MFLNFNENFLNIMENILYMLGGFCSNIYFSIIAIFFGFVGGFFLACLKFVHRGKWQANVSNAVVSVICGTPMVVQLMIYYYAVPSIIPISNMFSAIIGVAFNSACYFSLMFLDAMCAIDDTYFLNLRGLNVNKNMSIKKFLLPMVINNCYNKITFEFISLLKETAVLNAIGVNDIFARSKEMGWRSGSSYSYMFICAGIFYGSYILHKNFLHRFINPLLVRLLKFVLSTSNLMLLLYLSSSYLLYVMCARLPVVLSRMYL